MDDILSVLNRILETAFEALEYVAAIIATLFCLFLIVFPVIGIMYAIYIIL